jgi:hypothetical protein
MAKKSLLRRSKKKPNINRLASKIADKKFWGKQPDPAKDRAAFLTWCNAVVEKAEAKDWLETYLQTTGRTLRGVPDSWINPSICHRARLKWLNCPFTETQDRLLEEGIESILKHAQEVDDENAPAVYIPSIQERVRDKFHDVMGEIEGLLDDGIPADFDITKWFRDHSVSPTVAKMVADKLRPRADELNILLTSEDEEDPMLQQLFEGYSHMNVYGVEDLYKRLQLLIDDIDRMVQNEKRARVPRAPKPVSVEKKLKHINESYLKHSKDWNITSLDPSKILGANQLWTLNTKYKLLTVFRTDKMGGKLDVARCKVAGFNKNDSFTYRLGRGQKALQIVDIVLKSTPALIKDVVKDLKQAPLQERINENTLLLRV